MKKIALWKNVRVDDWTVQRAIIASNGMKKNYEEIIYFD